MIKVNLVIKQEETKELIINQFAEVRLVSCDQRSVVFETPNDHEYLDKIKSFLKGRSELMAVYFSVEIK